MGKHEEGYHQGEVSYQIAKSVCTSKGRCLATEIRTYGRGEVLEIVFRESQKQAALPHTCEGANGGARESFSPGFARTNTTQVE
jgi:hypothetical protein